MITFDERVKNCKNEIRIRTKRVIEAREGVRESLVGLNPERAEVFIKVWTREFNELGKQTAIQNTLDGITGVTI